jgi:hypothetical protein
VLPDRAKLDLLLSGRHHGDSSSTLLLRVFPGLPYHQCIAESSLLDSNCKLAQLLSPIYSFLPVVESPRESRVVCLVVKILQHEADAFAPFLALFEPS